MNKKVKLNLLLAVVSIFSLASCGGSSSSEDTSSIRYQMGKMFSDANFKFDLMYQDSIYNFLIDGSSFAYTNDQETWNYFYKYKFINDYCYYVNNELIDNAYKPTSLIGEGFVNYINPNYLNNNNFIYENGVYTLNQNQLSLYQLDIYQSSLSYLYISANGNDGVNFDLTFDDGATLKYTFKRCNNKINNYNKTLDDYDNYYENNNISYQDLKQKINDQEDFGLIIISDTCSVCEKVEPLYYEFFVEYNISYYYVLTIQDLSTDEKVELSKLIASTYISEDNKEYLFQGYDTYPSSFLTPTNVRFIDGICKFVLPGFGLSMSELFYRFCFN